MLFDTHAHYDDDIIVGVALDTARSLEGYMTARHHKGFLE